MAWGVGVGVGQKWAGMSLFYFYRRSNKITGADFTVQIYVLENKLYVTLLLSRRGYYVVDAEIT